MYEVRKAKQVFDKQKRLNKMYSVKTKVLFFSSKNFLFTSSNLGLTIANILSESNSWVVHINFLSAYKAYATSLNLISIVAETGDKSCEPHNRVQPAHNRNGPT